MGLLTGVYPLNPSTVWPHRAGPKAGGAGPERLPRMPSKWKIVPEGSLLYQGPLYQLQVQLYGAVQSIGLYSQ